MPLALHPLPRTPHSAEEVLPQAIQSFMSHRCLPPCTLCVTGARLTNFFQVSVKTPALPSALPSLPLAAQRLVEASLDRLTPRRLRRIRRLGLDLAIPQLLLASAPEPPEEASLDQSLRLVLLRRPPPALLAACLARLGQLPVPVALARLRTRAP